jgi:hypothetical protein
MRIHFPVLVLVAMSIQATLGAETPARIERPAPESGPTQVSVGIWIVDISKIDSAEQSFTAEVALVLRWKESRLAHTGSGIARYPLEQVWHPRVAVANETSSVSRKFPDFVEVEPDGTVTYRQLYAGAFTRIVACMIAPSGRVSRDANSPPNAAEMNSINREAAFHE